MRILSSRLMLEMAERVGAHRPLIMMGDFNTVPDSEPHQVLVQDEEYKMYDAWRVAHHTTGPEETFHGFSDEVKNRIDWIIVSDGINVREMEHIQVKRGNVYPSDHMPISALIQLPYAHP